MNYAVRSEISRPDQSLTPKRTDQPIGLIGGFFAGSADPAKQWPAIADKTRNVSELKDEEISAIKEAVASLSQDGPSS